MCTASDLFAVTGPSKKLNRGPVGVLRAQLRERRLPLPEREDLALERVVVGLVREAMRTSPDSRGETTAREEPAPPSFELVENKTTNDHDRKDSMATAVKNDTFEQEVIQSETPVLVDFWAEWCGPCHAVAPVLDRIVEEQAGALKLVKVNIDEERELAERFGIASIPTMILFRDGEPSVSVIGAQPKGAIERTARAHRRRSLRSSCPPDPPTSRLTRPARRVSRCSERRVPRRARRDGARRGRRSARS